MNPLRKIECVTYWVIEDPGQIRKFVNTNIRREWLKDAEDDDVDPEYEPWLRSLSKLRWSIKTVKLAEIRLNPLMMNRRSFIARLEERSSQLRRGIELYGQVIWPIILSGEDSLLKDGYCRYTTLKQMNIRRTLAYIGSA